MKYPQILVLLGASLIVSTAQAQSTGFTATPELIAAAKKEGKLTVYTVQDPEGELKMVKAFNKRFPEIKVSMLRLPGGQLVTRVKAESSSNRLSADLISFSDTQESNQVAHVFAKYAPPNAADYQYLEADKDVWPRAIGTWVICSNTMTEKNPPKTWKDLLKPEYKGRMGEVTILTGGSGWTRSFFQREVMGIEYWQGLAANTPRLYPIGVPMTDALIRGEISVGALVSNQSLPKVAQGAPMQCFFPPEGVPAKPQVMGLTKTAGSPNAAKLYLDWMLSPEGQVFVVKEWFMFSALKGAPTPVGGENAKLWFVEREKSIRVQSAWVDEWVKIFTPKR